ncbi:DUF5071 domain-containing protein [Solibacillus sp. MA9]|uniref:DUF5071 domain-containing protein n=1 Tax=Solibacillus palustris TaxID=2908203 RepID=A0ABS9UBL2_9BACL|nr:DUF5071 domain-containing protein [Solibacillus sp. MA9]MCH7321719.1 DUF5071 domain-containing protein [Solibacillus sp. MA9]
MTPKNKFDIEEVETLRNKPANEVVPLLPELMTWMQDMNWPVAKSVVELLLTYPTEITPLIDEVLAGDDDMWVYWCLVELVPKLPFYSKLVLAEAVEQIASGQRGFDEDVIELAQEALRSFEP